VANPFTIALGKLVQAAARLKGGAGSAFPGLVVEKLEPNFAVRVLERLPRGVVVISGTNGKTTTTKIVTELLQAQGLKVFTNSTGSNFMRGVIASLLSQMTLAGKLDADIAVLELDEAHAVGFVRKIAPRYSLLLNVMRDQLDRFGEIDHTANLLAVIAQHTTEAVIINREDNRLAAFATREELLASQAQLLWYGLARDLKARFPQDDELYADTSPAPSPHLTEPEALVTLEALAGDVATYTMQGASYQTPLALKGVYNAYNAAAALALVSVILGDALRGATAPGDVAPSATPPNNAPPAEQLIKQLANVKSAFGRGESFTVDGRELELLLVKNPGGFRLALESFATANHDTMIAINDEYADGRDMSWLYDVEFTVLREGSVAMVSGTRAWDMALRLRYDEVPFQEVEPELNHALDRFIQSSQRPLRVYCTYTAMLRCRAHLGSYTAVSRVE
jgi:UDP-N-acetylmuramyl tripeptide synthase